MVKVQKNNQLLKNHIILKIINKYTKIQMKKILLKMESI
jgi:septum formation topological specificity factor MinE